jgi:YD repeat-containing protein
MAEAKGLDERSRYRISTNRYDAASNLTETTDAKGQRVSYTYDGANRILTEDYHDESSPELSYGRTPDIVFHYDAPAGQVDQGDGTRAMARNVKGMLAWVEDTSGEEHTSFDERGRVEWTVKRIPDPMLSSTLNSQRPTLVSYKTAFVLDSMDRVAKMIYPTTTRSVIITMPAVCWRTSRRSDRAYLFEPVYLPSAQQQRSTMATASAPCMPMTNVSGWLNSQRLIHSCRRN